MTNQVERPPGSGYASSIGNSPAARWVTVADGMSGILSGQTCFSIELWVKPDTLQGTQVWWSRDLGSNLWGGLFGGDAVLFQVSGTYLTVSSTHLTAQAWNHMVFVKDGGTTGRIYINGTDRGNGSVGATGSFSDEDLIFGMYWSNERSNYPFVGAMDEIRVYTRALSPTEVADHYNAGAGKWVLPESDLALGLHLDEGSGTSLADCSGNGHVCTFTNGSAYWTGGLAPVVFVDAVVIESADSVDPLEQGLHKFGDPAGCALLQGISLKLHTGGHERLRITADGKVGIGVTPEDVVHIAGKVGIGTQAPSARLDVGGNMSVSGDIYFFGRLARNTADEVLLGGNVGLGTLAGPSERLDVQGNIKLSGVLKQDGSGDNYLMGNLGIGTDSPNAALGLGGDAPRTIQMERHTVDESDGNPLTIKAGGAKPTSTNKAGGHLYLASGIATGDGVSNIYLQTAGGGAGGSGDRVPETRVTILGSGKVGIGTSTPGPGESNPAGTLEIAAGNLLVTAGRVGLGQNWGAYGRLDIRSVANGDYNAEPVIRLLAYDPAGHDYNRAHLWFAENAKTLQIQPFTSAVPGPGSWNDLALVPYGGNVGIGLLGASPQVKLQVGGDITSGDIRSGSIRVAGTETPSSGAGLELLGSSLTSYVQAYDRDEGTWRDVVIRGHAVGLGGGGATDSLWVHPLGNVGIGITNPGAKLHVAGGSVWVGGRVAIDSDGYSLYG